MSYNLQNFLKFALVITYIIYEALFLRYLVIIMSSG